MELAVVDIGGTHARFAIVQIEDGVIAERLDPVTLLTADHASLQTAWEEVARRMNRRLPSRAAFAIAAPVGGSSIRFTNNPWVIKTDEIQASLDLEQFLLVNDFEAVGHAVAQAANRDLRHLCGPEIDLPDTGVISVVGPGTGLGVSFVLRARQDYHVQPTEGGHADFAPTDAIEDAILAHLRKRLTRVSVERIVSGPGLVEIHAALAAIEGRPVAAMDDRTLWSLGLSGKDSLASAAVDRFCRCLGSVVGDIALTQGASGVVIAGGLGQRIADILSISGFADRFRAKGRFAQLMASIPVKIISHPQPGLFGAAAAFLKEHAK
jgi:glucokinase